MPIAALLDDDPWTRLSPAERIAAIKARRARLSAPPKPAEPPKPQAAAAAIVAPATEQSPQPKSFKPLWFSITESGERRYSIREIQLAVCAHFGVSLRDMLSERRHGEIVLPRHVAVYLCRELTLQSLPAIGRAFNRDHTTALFSVRKIAALIESHPPTREQVDAIRSKLEAAQVMMARAKPAAEPVSLTEEGLILMLWRQKYDTHSIARRLRLKEWQVHNTLLNLRSAA